jgi:hypothetical protein
VEGGVPSAGPNSSQAMRAGHPPSGRRGTAASVTDRCAVRASDKGASSQHPPSPPRAPFTVMRESAGGVGLPHSAAPSDGLAGGGVAEGDGSGVGVGFGAGPPRTGVGVGLGFGSAGAGATDWVGSG